MASKLGNTMLDKILAYYDANQQMIEQFCAPVNLKDNHWILMHVVMPCPKYTNGKVFLTNHDAMDNVPFSEQYPKSSVKYSQMWWAKWFGIYHKERTTKGSNGAHLDYTDMRIDRFSLIESTGCLTSDLVSSLDHDTNRCHGIGVQTDGYNCGIWVILELFNRMEGFTSAVGQKTNKELNEFRVTLFNLLIHIYELLCKEAIIAEGLNANPVVKISPTSATTRKKSTGCRKDIENYKEVDIENFNRLGSWYYWLKYNETIGKKRNMANPTNIILQQVSDS